MNELEERIHRGQEAIRKASAEGHCVADWTKHLLQLESALRESQEITRLMEADGYAIVWSDVLRETIAFCRDDVAAAQVPASIIVYTRAELERIMGKGHSPDMLKLIHEAKKHGAKITNPKGVTP